MDNDTTPDDQTSPDDDESGWIWGIFYANRKDKRVFVPKHFGKGWTLNFGNLLSIVFLILIVALPYIITKFF